MSPIELLVLATVPENYVNIKEIISKLVARTNNWEPQAGTLYPILHRLEKSGFLEKTRSKHIRFKRASKGSFFLGSILNSLLLQIEEDHQYYLSLISAIINVKPVPMGLHDFIDNLVDSATTYLSEIKELVKEADQIVDDAVDVDVVFD